jgi:hypothetical protein
MNRVTMVASFVLLLNACSSHEAAERPAAAASSVVAVASPSTASDSSVSRQLMHDVQSSPQLYDIGTNQGDGLGHYALRFAGKPVWPPRGARCGELLRCCRELATMADSLALACLLATARDQNCRIARRTTSEIALEQGHNVPASCSP